MECQTAWGYWLSMETGLHSEKDTLRQKGKWKGFEEVRAKEQRNYFLNKKRQMNFEEESVRCTDLITSVCSSLFFLSLAGSLTFSGTAWWEKWISEQTVLLSCINVSLRVSQRTWGRGKADNFKQQYFSLTELAGSNISVRHLHWAKTWFYLSDQVRRWFRLIAQLHE